MLKISYKTYYDRVMAGWLGKSMGGVVGAPFECHKQFNHIPKERLWPEKLWPNDDLDIQVVWLEAFQELGLEFSSLDLAQFWKSRCFYTCCEYGVFINNLEHGIHPPLSGIWNNEWFQSSEGCPIRSEIWGFVNPGNPRLACHYAALDGCLDHSELSISMEQFLSAAASLAFFESSIEDLLEKTCTHFSADHPAVRIYREVQKITVQHSSSYNAWLCIVRRYGHRDSTRAEINNAFTFMALLLGKNDFRRTMQLCVQSGWDCDCSAATAGALLGALFGTIILPGDWLEKLGKNLVCAVEIKHQFQPIAEFAAETCAIGIEMAAQKNKDIEIVDAPEVPIRPLRKPQTVLTVEYPEGPALYRNRPTSVRLLIGNRTASAQAGMLSISVPEHLQCTPRQLLLSLPASDEQAVDCLVSLKPGSIMQDTNLLQARFASTSFEFGLAGTRRLLVYGPYWDMWDKTLNAECPYQNAQLTCNPGNLPEFSSDAMNMHVRYDHPYLDEKLLLTQSLHDEQPIEIETARQCLSNQDMCSFTGAATWYLETTIKSYQPREVSFSAQANCPYRCWLDGKLVFSRNEYTNHTSPSQKIQLTGQKQRLVCKFSSQLDCFSFSLAFLQENPSKKYAVSPYFSKFEYY